MGMANTFTLLRKLKDAPTVHSKSLKDGFQSQATPMRWLVIIPHDDDGVIGAGLLLQILITENVPVRILVTTDGSQGYCDTVNKHHIRLTRRQETLAAYALLGITDIQWLDFPDSRLSQFSGRWPSESSSPNVIEGHTGIQNGFTFHLRKFKPTHVLVATSRDIHPDHQIVHQEVLISLFHGAGTIWPELGSPLNKPPDLYEMAVYCDFPGPPNVKLIGQQFHLDKKMNALKTFESQTQIESLLSRLSQDGPIEYFRKVDIPFYTASNYASLF